MKALTVQIGIFGRTNVGKSSLMNFITNQDTSIVSDIKGTTTDVVSKQMELNPLGPITLFDTAGLDDKSSLGEVRVEKTKRAFDSCDVILLMCEFNMFGTFEENIIREARLRKTPIIIVVSKADLQKPDEKFLPKLEIYSKHVLEFSKMYTMRDNFLTNLKKILLEILPDNYIENYLALRNIVKKNDTVILVMPIDLGAPRGKIIMPQVQTLRHILDLNAASYTVQDTEYETTLKALKIPPKLVITDSQAIKTIAAKTPKNIKLTTFSIIYAADKSDIIEMAKGASKINSLQNGDKILIAEACTHHASKDDIGRIKIPKWISEYTKKDLSVEYVSGQNYPKNLSQYNLVIHCGACTLNRKGMLARLNKAVQAGVPITNYGIVISVFAGVIEKVLEIFPQALLAYKKSSFCN
ncbi:MAG: [FeFe] hydrogenase H-cluster maturation GTPase HydF [Endomicrobium sp.]|jgi:[FeFe] hydrogenase H-cluster maturation GTPase HydF|uniref:[FeFe] hydrogenase H-cluster maturation GTPase HydF n=1 Tax=Candidatus Endomicrobiellum cubanum TaxID=3242325 RepID=UPI002824F190|nr:[FeFe] hydrogenase H-cluster maturation GTPase HydF [Endomicrobium sp.]